MTLKTYITQLIALTDERPEVLDFDVVTSSDDEGNCYGLVYYAPSVGYFSSQDFCPEYNGAEKPNAVCLN